MTEIVKVSGVEQVIDDAAVIRALGLAVYRKVEVGKPVMITEMARTGDDRKFIIDG